MAAPVPTIGVQYAALASQPLAAGQSITFTLDYSTAYGGKLQVMNTAGATVAATAGLQVSVFDRVGNPIAVDTVAGVGPFTIASVASTAQYQTINLQWGRYSITLKNLDATNAVTVGATSDLLASIQ